MKAILLDGSQANDATGKGVSTALIARLQARGWEVEHAVLRDKKIGNCAGDFFCWIRSPGMCNVDDDNREIAAAIVGSDLLVYLTPVTFGGYASTLKRMVDHQIQNILPFFTKIDGQTHHQRRYPTYPDFLAVGWLDALDPQAEAIFRHLVQRNALNFYARTTVCGIVTAGRPETEVMAQADDWLEALARGVSSPTPDLPGQRFGLATAAPVSRAVLLVGSPRTRKSTSYALGDYFMAQLKARGVQTETIHIYTSLNSPARMQALFDAVDAADLIVLAFPIYVDSLPAPVVVLLERLAAHRSAPSSPARFAAIANCGFPEASHTATALAACGQFATQSGLTWAGGLGVGAGEGLVHGVPLAELDGRVTTIRRALDLAAAALAQGQPIPPAAQDLLARPVIPNWLYRLAGGFGWRQQAKKYRAQKLLKRQTYAA